MSVNPFPPMPSHDVPFTDPKTGKITKAWQDWLTAVIAALRALVALS